MLLLDTCVLIWLTSEPSRLSAAACKAIDGTQDLGLSDACVWEICLKWQIHKLVLPAPPRTWIAEQSITWALQRVAIEPEHFYRTTELADHHRDPFDRLLVAQALTHTAPIVSPDSAIKRYPVSVVW